MPGPVVARPPGPRVPLAAAVLDELEVELSVAPAPVAAMSAPAASQSVAVDQRDVLVSVYLAAEKLDVPARRFRAVIAELVAEWSAAKWDTGTIATALSHVQQPAPPAARVAPEPAPRTGE